MNSNPNLLRISLEKQVISSGQCESMENMLQCEDCFIGLVLCLRKKKKQKASEGNACLCIVLH